MTMSRGPLSAVVLAAGEGKRMRSERPKPLHALCGRAMVLHLIDTVAELDVDRVVVVVGHGADQVTKAVVEEAPSGVKLDFVEQRHQRGTGDALSAALTVFPDDVLDGDDILVLPGDTPLLRPETLAALLDEHQSTDAIATVVTAQLPDPTGYGRVVRDRHGNVARVVDEAVASDLERKIDEVNTSCYRLR